jgi:hypothetical protein
MRRRGGRVGTKRCWLGSPGPLARLGRLARLGSLGPLARLVLAALVLSLPATACRPADAELDAAGLAAMIDSLLPPIAGASGLEVLRPVEHTLQPAAEARAFIERQLDEMLGEVRAMERAYREFGLLPDTLDLRALLLDLYTEQVVGYYDPKESRLYVVEGIPARTAAPVVAHELVHALQDQHFDLDALVDPERGNDRQMAAQAAAEGQATLVMIALQAAETAGRPIEPGALPDLGPLLRPALEAEYADFPVFARAPRLIRETLLFPYLHGANFVQTLYRYRPMGSDPPVPFGDLLPTSTQQVLHPVERFILERAEPLEIRLDGAGAGWSIAYENTLGQFELGILLGETLGDAAADLAASWAGDRYALLDGPDGETALVWYTAWEDAAAADRFATRYRQVMDRRDGRHGTISRQTHDGRPVVRVLQAPATRDLASVMAPAIRVMETRPEL